MITPAARPAPRAAVLLTGLALALLLRLQLAGDTGVHSGPASLVFAAVLIVFAVAGGWRPGALRVGPILLGLLGATVLLLFPAWFWLDGQTLHYSLPLGEYPAWTTIVIAVAVAEEVLLRGALFALTQPAIGGAGAVAITSVAFALLHVPLYGWGALPLDLAVGIWLGTLRLVSGSVVAPVIAHTLADLASWWLL